MASTKREFAVVIGNGEPPTKQLFDAITAPDALVICADGGANALAALGVKADYVVGDFDSVSEQALSGVPADHRIRVDADNTSTDLVKALNHALSLGVRSAALLGVTGGRVDHTLWNLSLLKKFQGRLQLKVIDAWCETELIDARGIQFDATPGQKLSLCPLGGPVSGITTSGLKFPLSGESLAPGERDGISNEVVHSPVTIHVGAGDLLLCLQRQ